MIWEYANRLGCAGCRRFHSRIRRYSRFLVKSMLEALLSSRTTVCNMLGYSTAVSLLFHSIKQNRTHSMWNLIRHWTLVLWRKIISFAKIPPSTWMKMHSVLLVISRTWIRSISSSAFNSIEIIYTKSMINLVLVVFKTNTKHRFIFTCLASIICCCNLSIVLFAKAFCIWYSQFECSNILPNTNLAHTTTTTIQIEILNSENFFLLLAHAHFEQHSALYFSSSAQPLRAFIKVKCTKEGNGAHCMENVTGFRNKP